MPQAKSDAQLNAEAAAPPPPITARILLHRQYAAAETWIPRLHVRDGERGDGLAFSGAFVAFLDQEFGGVFPWFAGWTRLRGECDTFHKEHELNCADLVAAVVRWEWGYEWVCGLYGLDPARTERTLHRALRHIEQVMADRRARAAERAHSDRGRHDWQAPRYQHIPLPGLHALECPQCRKTLDTSTYYGVIHPASG